MQVEVESLSVAHGRTIVLFDVSLALPDGTLLALLGRNGVGKSTLLNALCGLLPVRGGRILVDGRDITKDSASTRARSGIGYVPQGHPVFPHLTVSENLRVVLERTRGNPVSAIDDALDVFPRLKPLLDRPAGLLSGGQAQQLAIARALVTRPRILLLDEPTEGIQPSIILEIEDSIARLHVETGMSILLVEQYVEFALRLADRYVVMDSGAVVADGDTADADLSQFTELVAI